MSGKEHLKSEENHLMIQLKKRPVVFLIGNGFCRAAGQSSCDDFIEKIRKKENPAISAAVLKELPFSQQIVAATNDKVTDYLKKISMLMTQIHLDQDCCSLFRLLESGSADAILTANYSNEIEQSFIDNYTSYQYRMHRCMTRKEDNRIRRLLFQYQNLSDGGASAPIWHIHGNAWQPSSMVMGHYYYGKLLNEIEKYVPSLIRRCRIAEKNGEETIEALSWVDYFLLGDVHIIGFGMDPAEMDLWWLLCCKKRNFPDASTVFYEASKDDIYGKGKALLMQNYGVRIMTPDHFNGNYKEYYERVLRQII